MEQIQESIKEKKDKELKEKQALESAKDIFKAHIEKAMAKRNEEWEQKKKEFVTSKMNALKELILEHARSEYQKDKNKEIIAQKARERAERDKAIAQKGGATASEIEAEATGKNLDSNEFKRGNFDKASPSKPDRPARNNADDGFAIKRSDKPRVAPTEEESKGSGRPTFTRGPPRTENKDSDTGFARGNFTKKTEDSGPPKRTERKPAADSGASGFGFRNTNATRGKPAAKK